VFWLSLLWLGCGAHKPPHNDGPVIQRMAVRISANFGALADPDSGAVLQEGTSADLDLVIALSPTRRFRDGSQGQKILIETASLKVGTEKKDHQALSLAGRTAELRTFPDGEILAIDWVDRLAGADRFIDVFEVIFPVISPAPPSLRAGEEASRRIIWPFLGASKLRWDSAVDAVWKNDGLETRADSKAWRLSYAGPWRTHGGRRVEPGRVQFRGEGEAEGTVWFDKTTGSLSAHTFSWSRAVKVKGTGGALTQSQTFEGTLEVIR
jgi:hypothetical protein